MPQLSPINWMFVCVFFWFVVMVVSIVLWWSMKVNYSVVVSGVGKECSSVDNEFMWSW
uniref:ATP synthase F0 subunit 8 n=1 Tax=Pectinodonta sp. TaxID=3071117 RepID=A0AA96HTJ9_9GAST|nr:ATP synthase F0 subunit 8 [Pectinodonta sp.]